MLPHRLTLPLLLTLIVLGDGSPVPAQQGGSNREQFTNKSRFKIPFRFDAAELEQLGAREVELWESRDRGATWKARNRVAPTAGKFQYEATESGSYWFCLKLIDRNQNLHPNSAPRAGLKVYVDLDLPQVDLQLSQGSPGTVQISWNLSDDALELNTLRLRIRQPQREWKEHSIRRAATGSDDIRVEGTGKFEAELAVADLAGNETIERQSIQIRGAGNPPTSTRGEKIATRQRDPGGDRLEMASQFPGPRSKGVKPVAAAPQVDRSTPATPVADAGTGPKNVRRTSTSETTTATPRTVRYVNTLQFDLKYRLRDVAPDEKIPVELWMTADGGASWQLASRDDAGRSPLQVTVEQPGEYGVQLAWQRPSGRGASRPQDGTPPRDLFIVDRRAPELELLGVQSSHKGNIQTVTIRWRAADEHFSDTPIRLLWGPTAEGPWSEAIADLPNDGRYDWKPESQLPDSIFVRLEARDQAGNLRIAESPRPVRLSTGGLEDETQPGNDAAPLSDDSTR